MSQVWFYESRVGTFYITEERGRYLLKFEDDPLSSYDHPWQASDDLSLGTVDSILDHNGNIIDVAFLDIPSDLKEWQHMLPM